MKAYLVLVFVVWLSSAAGLLFRDSRCYGKYGCFDKKPPFNRPFEKLPQHPSIVRTRFLLYTRTNPSSQELNDNDVIKLLTSRFVGKKKTVIVVHGFTEHESVPWMISMKQALLKKGDMNVILVGWRTTLIYPQAVGNTRLVGAQIAELIKFLIRHKHNSASMYHVIGFSLGSHIAGYAGRRLRMDGKTLGRISGLDPAGPWFTGLSTEVKLDPSDAEFVDVVHTDSNVLGLRDVCGHIDFYPNGGANQRCRSEQLFQRKLFQGKSLPEKLFQGKVVQGVVAFASCDHMRAPDYYTESILTSCPQIAYPCSSIIKFFRGKCVKCNNKCATFGYDSVKSKGKLSGKFFLHLKLGKPHCGTQP